MKTRQALPATAAVLALILLPGCYAFYPRGPYPGMYAPGNGPMMPAQPTKTTFVAPGDLPTASGTTPTIAQPADSNSSSIPSGTFSPSGPVRAPDFNPSGTSSDQGRDTLVPEPRDPGTGLNDDPAERTSERPIESSAVEPEATRISSVRSSDAVFLSPVTDEPASETTRVVAAGHDQPLTVRDSGPLGRARDFEWVQGELQYDVEHGTWHLLYDQSPAQSDPQGGEITIDGNPGFRTTDNNHIFRVYGQRDPSRLDRMGKPVYRVSRAQLVEKR